MMIQPRVTFHTGDGAIQRLHDTAVRRARGNLQSFAGDRVLVEGGGYGKIWLETQPMGGEMFAPWDMEAAVNNQLLFMRCQRADGRLPGSIACTDGRVTPQFDKLQGFCFPWHALNMYWWLGQDREYLDALADTLVRFDGWLHRTRDLDGSGCLASFCVYDTGEDNALRYGDAPNYCLTDTPPEFSGVVPMTSMDVTSYSYACRDTLAEISRLRGDGQEIHWRRMARETAEALRSRLWDEGRGACFDIDRQGRCVDVMCHNTLRCMHWGSLAQGMADRFVREHLLNPRAFWTEMPLPSVAADDPLFRNAPENNWSGQCEGLTYQRAILALERYGYEPLVTRLGRRLMRAVIDGGYLFTQQFDPFTGAPSRVSPETKQPLPMESNAPCQDDYGPTLLSVLGYTARMHGVAMARGRMLLSMAGGLPCEYTLDWGDRSWRTVMDGREAAAFLNGREIWRGKCGQRVLTDLAGQVVDIRSFE